MLTHLPSTENSVPETATNGDDHLLLSLGDVRVVRAKRGERKEESQNARATREYMPVQLGAKALGRKGTNPLPFSKLGGPAGREPESHENVEGSMQSPTIQPDPSVSAMRARDHPSASDNWARLSLHHLRTTVSVLVYASHHKQTPWP